MRRCNVNAAIVKSNSMPSRLYSPKRSALVVRAMSMNLTSLR